jgi:hypothetical protein
VSVDWRALHDGEFRSPPGGLLDLDRQELADRIDWPPAD